MNCQLCGQNFTYGARNGARLKFCTKKCMRMAERERNRKRINHYARKYYHTNPYRKRDYTYGEGAGAHLQKQLAEQNNLCAICGKLLSRPNLDHHHGTSRLRGAVCNRCNLGLGHIEAEGWLEKALAYIKKWEGSDGVLTVRIGSDQIVRELPSRSLSR